MSQSMVMNGVEKFVADCAKMEFKLAMEFSLGDVNDTKSLSCRCSNAWKSNSEGYWMRLATTRAGAQLVSNVMVRMLSLRSQCKGKACQSN